jgi:hypothetical protein
MDSLNKHIYIDILVLHYVNHTYLWCSLDFNVICHTRRRHAVAMLQAGRSRVRFPMRWIFFNLPNPYSRTISLESTHPLTEMSTRNLPGSKGWPGRKAGKLTAICEPIVWTKCSSLDVSQSCGPSRCVTGIALPLSYLSYRRTMMKEGKKVVFFEQIIHFRLVMKTLQDSE